jgi:hypothetical protein
VGLFLYLKQTFLRISETKINEGMFVDKQIREIMRDSESDETLSEVERASSLKYNLK